VKKKFSGGSVTLRILYHEFVHFAIGVIPLFSRVFELSEPLENGQNRAG